MSNYNHPGLDMMERLIAAADSALIFAQVHAAADAKKPFTSQVDAILGNAATAVAANQSTTAFLRATQSDNNTGSTPQAGR